MVVLPKEYDQKFELPQVSLEFFNEPTPMVIVEGIDICEDNSLNPPIVLDDKGQGQRGHLLLDLGQEHEGLDPGDPLGDRLPTLVPPPHLPLEINGEFLGTDRLQGLHQQHLEHFVGLFVEELEEEVEEHVLFVSFVGVDELVRLVAGDLRLQEVLQRRRRQVQAQRVRLVQVVQQVVLLAPGQLQQLLDVQLRVLQAL